VDAPRGTFVVSHEAIDGVMDAMVMSFEVRETRALEALTPGDTVRFTLVMADGGAHAEAIAVIPYESAELDPLVAGRLRLLESLVGAPRPEPLAVGAAVPDFTLTDQTGAQVSLSQFRGQVIAVNF